MPPSILVVLTSWDHVPGAKPDRPTGWYLPELSHPYDVLATKNATLTFASPLGGRAPVDPYSVETTKTDPSCTTFLTTFASQLASTHTLASLRGHTASYDAIFFPGGAGPMWDLATDADAIALIEEFVSAGKPVASVCHAPAVLQGVKTPQGAWLVEGREVTGLSDEEERLYGLEEFVPFSIEGRLRERGAKYVKAKEVLGECVVVDGVLITGQNVTSARVVGEALVRALGV